MNNVRFGVRVAIVNAKRNVTGLEDLAPTLRADKNQYHEVWWGNQRENAWLNGINARTWMVSGGRRRAGMPDSSRLVTPASLEGRKELSMDSVESS